MLSYFFNFWLLLASSHSGEGNNFNRASCGRVRLARCEIRIFRQELHRNTYRLNTKTCLSTYNYCPLQPQNLQSLWSQFHSQFHSQFCTKADLVL